MGKAFYRKYRSKKLSEVIGQEHITSTLERALKNGALSHAYLFTGPRGVGKTSVARIMAHEINKLPYTDDAAHLDIIEIDAASNRRIDEIRELREKVFTAPASAPYKVYIIDEVHMLTREAFNALLKTLEEPPAHVIFILATTDAHKLPETIVSRTQRFSFRPVPKDKVIEHLRTIAQSEGLEVDEDALELLAMHGEGSFRDSISLLDQASSQGQKLSAQAVRDLLGIPAAESLEQLYRELSQGTSASLMKQLAALYDKGYAAPLIAKELGVQVRHKIVASEAPEGHLHLLEQLLEVAATSEPAQLLEIILLKAQHSQPVTAATPQPTASLDDPKKTPAKPIEPKRASAHKPPPAPRAVAPTPTTTNGLSLASWPEILTVLKKRHNTLYGVVRMAEPDFGDAQTLQLKFSFAFHQKRINEPANRQILTGIIKEVTGLAVLIECVYDKDAIPPKLPSNPASAVPAAPAVKDESLDTISNIFGGGELLES